MKKCAVITGMLVMLFVLRTSARHEYSPVNMYVQATVQFPVGSMYDYYGFGPGYNVHLVASISKRKSLVRLSALLNTGYYSFSGQDWWDANYNEHTYDGVGMVPLHAGLRFDLGNTKDVPVGLYMSQEFGPTFIRGGNGGTRYGHSFNMGFIIWKFDFSGGYEKIKRSTGSNFGFLTFGFGFMLF